MANSAYWYGHVVRRENSQVQRMALEFEVECQREGVQKTWKKQVEKERMNVI